MTSARLLPVLLSFTLVLPALAAEGPARTKAPSFRSVDLAGEKVSLEDLLGKGPVVVDFWATWCKPCIKELPFLQRIHEQYGPKGAQVVAVTIDSPKSQSQVKKFIATRGYTFRVLMDGDQDVFRKLMGRGSIPYVVVLDSEGRFRWQHTGYMPGDEKELERIVVELLGGAAPAAGSDGAAESGGAPQDEAVR